MRNRASFIIMLIALVIPSLPYAAEVKIITTIFPLTDMVRQVGGNAVTVSTLLPPGASPHTFEPSPKQMAELSDAKALFKIGAGLEFWAERVVKAASNKSLRIIDLSEGVPLDYGAHAHGDEHRESPKKDGRRPDPHYWLDPVLAQKMVDRIAEVLGDIDPKDKVLFTRNAAAYKKEIESLHQDIARSVSQFRTKEYVTFHSGWHYFSKRYGLKVIGVIEEAPGREPTPRDVARIVRELREKKARVVFAEPQFNPKVAEAIAKEGHAKVLFLDPLGAPNTPGRDTYLKLMRYNLSQMERAMK